MGRIHPGYTCPPMAADKRLKNVHQADLTESRVNDDFVYWLKTWGSNILIVLLLIAAGYMGYNWWEQKREQARDDAWSEVNGAALPEALIEVAQKHEGKDSVSIFAELVAADRYADALMKGKRFDREATATDAAITPELRAEWQKKADDLYANVAKASANPTDMGKRMFYVSALFGRAAMAEDRGDVKSAQQYLEGVAAAVKGTDQAGLGDVATKRIATLSDVSTPIVFASRPAPLPGTEMPPLTAPSLLQNTDLPGPLIKNADGTFTQKVPGGTLNLKPSPDMKPVQNSPDDNPTIIRPGTTPTPAPPSAPPATAPSPSPAPSAPPATPPAAPKQP